MSELVTLALADSSLDDPDPVLALAPDSNSLRLFPSPEPNTGAPSTPGTPVNLGARSSPTASPSARVGSETAAIHVHKARLQDARNIFDLVNSLSGDGTLLRRSYAELCENIRDFTVVENAEGEFLGCGALHLYGPHLAEVRSIVVREEARGTGAGAALLRALIAEAEEHQVASVCLFTRLPDFFGHFGFRVAERDAMPDKIYKDCQTCPRLYACDEVAMVRGPLPNIAVLGPKIVERPELVQIHPFQLTGTGR